MSSSTNERRTLKCSLSAMLGKIRRSHSPAPERHFSWRASPGYSDCEQPECLHLYPAYCSPDTYYVSSLLLTRHLLCIQLTAHLTLTMYLACCSPDTYHVSSLLLTRHLLCIQLTAHSTLAMYPAYCSLSTYYVSSLLLTRHLLHMYPDYCSPDTYYVSCLLLTRHLLYVPSLLLTQQLLCIQLTAHRGRLLTLWYSTLHFSAQCTSLEDFDVKHRGSY